VAYHLAVAHVIVVGSKVLRVLHQTTQVAAGAQLGPKKVCWHAVDSDDGPDALTKKPDLADPMNPLDTRSGPSSFFSPDRLCFSQIDDLCLEQH
jgi:hypothetical protein